MTSPEGPAELARASQHIAPPDDVRSVAPTERDGAVDVDGSFHRLLGRGLNVDRLALALLLIAVFVAVPLGLLALQAT